MSKTIEERIEAVERFLGFPVEVVEEAPPAQPAQPQAPADEQNGDAPSA